LRRRGSGKGKGRKKAGKKKGRKGRKENTTSQIFFATAL